VCRLLEQSLPEWLEVLQGHNLDELEAQDFATILIWLKGAGVERILKTPRPYQEEALDDIHAVLSYEDRATVLMACGTGKTIAALWVCERMHAQNILVLVPSLALLRQTLHEWMRQTAWPLVARLCVCSDPSVQSKIDQIILRPEDLDFPVTTDSRGVRKFSATAFRGVKLIFSTYQSAHVVAKGMKPDQSFDLAIFDEAHKTAGPHRGSFGLALEDKHLPINKRLSLTATRQRFYANFRA
jgi:predicted helicase